MPNTPRALKLCWSLSPKKCRSMPTSKMANHAKRGWKDSHFEILRDPSPFCFSTSHKWVLMILPFQIHPLPLKTYRAWPMQFSKALLKSCTFQKYLKKHSTFLKFAISDFEENKGFKKKNKGKKCPTASKKWKRNHSSMQSYKVAPFKILHELKMRTRLHGFCKSFKDKYLWSFPSSNQVDCVELHYWGFSFIPIFNSCRDSSILLDIFASSIHQSRLHHIRWRRDAGRGKTRCSRGRDLSAITTWLSGENEKHWKTMNENLSASKWFADLATWTNADITFTFCNLLDS